MEDQKKKQSGILFKGRITGYVMICGWGFINLLFVSACDLFDSDSQYESLEFEKMHVHYIKQGGWIPTSELLVQPSGEAVAKVVTHASGEVLMDTTTTLTGEQRTRLTDSFSSFARYKKNYQPEKFLTDGNYHLMILTYEGVADTVSVYMPDKAPIPKSLKQLILNLEELHTSLIDIR